MSAQTTLTEDAPMILDATCSFAKIWPRHASLRIDIRRECKPDVQASAIHLPFRDGLFDSIYCDPPHMIRKDWSSYDSREKMMDKIITQRRLSGRLSNSDFSRYGAFPDRKTWEAFVKATDSQFARTLKLTGTLFYKITESPKNEKRMSHPKDLEAMKNFKVIKRKITPSKSRFSVGNLVHWLTMKPTGDESVEGKKDE